MTHLSTTLLLLTVSLCLLTEDLSSLLLSPQHPDSPVRTFAEARAQFNFKRYTYRKKRDDKKFRAAKQRCEMSSECHGLWGVEHTRCVQTCVSPTCYQELYGSDPLEEGEVDVRLNSFKGCLSQVPVVDF